MSTFERLRERGMWNIHVMLILVAKFFASGLIFKYIPFLQFENSWDMLLAKGAFALVFAIIARVIFGKANADLKDVETEVNIKKKK